MAGVTNGIVSYSLCPNDPLKLTEARFLIIVWRSVRFRCFESIRARIVDNLGDDFPGAIHVRACHTAGTVPPWLNVLRRLLYSLPWWTAFNTTKVLLDVEGMNLMEMRQFGWFGLTQHLEEPIHKVGRLLISLIISFTWWLRSAKRNMYFNHLCPSSQAMASLWRQFPFLWVKPVLGPGSEWRLVRCTSNRLLQSFLTTWNKSIWRWDIQTASCSISPVNWVAPVPTPTRFTQCFSLTISRRTARVAGLVKISVFLTHENICHLPRS